MKEISIKGKTWKIEEKSGVELDSVPCDGICDPESHTIFIDKKIKGLKRRETLLHECLHAIFSETHIDISAELEEVIVGNCASAVTSLFHIRLK